MSYLIKENKNNIIIGDSMKITSIKPQKRKQDRVNIYIDDKFSFGLSQDIIYKFGLYVDMEISDEFINEILLKEEERKVLDSALNFLSYRARSEKEVYTRLTQKEYPHNFILSAIAYCKEHGYINDKEFALSFIRDKTNINKYGPKKLKYELYKKGVSQSIIDEVLISDKDTEYEMALELGLKRLDRYKNDSKDAIYRKLGGFLQRKGYSYDIVYKVLREIVE